MSLCGDHVLLSLPGTLPLDSSQRSSLQGWGGAVVGMHQGPGRSILKGWMSEVLGAGACLLPTQLCTT